MKRLSENCSFRANTQWAEVLVSLDCLIFMRILNFFRYILETFGVNVFSNFNIFFIKVSFVKIFDLMPLFMNLQKPNAFLLVYLN